MEMRKIHWLGIFAAVAIVAFDLIFFIDDKKFYIFISLAFIIFALPFAISSILESRTEKENNEMFLEFARNLVESVKAGTPISRAIVNLRDKYYGTLTPYTIKLANQITIGVPLKDALDIFARDVNSRTIERAISLIGQAEKAGGEIQDILASVAKSVEEIENLKKERESSISSLVIEGYIIFFVFLVIMLVMQFKIFPMTEDFFGAGGEGIAGLGTGISNISVKDISKPLSYLIIIQGFFTGLTIGKLSSGSIKSGFKHSFIMVSIALLTLGVSSLFF